jgi:hypothetical protein
MKPIFSRRSRHRTQRANDGAFFKKDASPGFFGEGEHESFFSPASTTESPNLQRKCAECEKEDKNVQREPDKKEDEKVMRAEDKKEEDKVQRAEDKKEEDKPVQKKENGASTGSSKSVSGYIGSLNGKGQSLSPVANQFFSSRMGYDFSNVKIHTDKEAIASAKAINAKAYTTGKDIVFNEGQFDTGSATGKKLLAHELTHVMQQDKAQADEIDRKITYDAAQYTETDPVTTVLDNPNLALTTPLINGTPLPNDNQAAGSLLANAFTPGLAQLVKDGKTSCVLQEPDVHIGASVLIIKKPTGNVWQGSAEGKKFKDKSAACENVGNVTVYIKGKGGKKAIDVYNKVDANETEHVKDIEAISDRHLKGLMDFLNKFGQKAVSGTDKEIAAKCTEMLNKYIGKKDSEMISAFLSELRKKVAERDKVPGPHHFTPDVHVDGKDCFSIVIKI